MSPTSGSPSSGSPSGASPSGLGPTNAGRAPARVIGWAATAAAIVLLFVLQIVHDDWLPPEISMSQFGLGPHGWILSVFLLTIAAASLAWYRVGPPDRLTLLLLGIGSFGAAVAALIPTQAGGLQESWNAVVHMIGSALMVAGLPFGLCRMVWVRPRPWRIAAVVLLVLSAASLILLLFAALGWDTAGRGPQGSWAWWQGVSVVTELSLLVLVAFARGLRTRPDRRSVPLQG